jgi:glycosyltransferase involved in cell wall biosynthesis
VVSHGNRAGCAVLRAARGRWPIVARLPNYSFRRVLACDGFIATTRDLAEALERSGVSKERVFLVPNMLGALPSIVEAGHSGPPVIGALGRFVAAKGFDVLLRALAILRDSGHAFRAVIGGDGEQRRALEALAGRCGLGDRVVLPGWITDKDAFFRSLTLLCVPSLVESFGIVVLEGMSYRLPVVVTDAPGPRQIVKDGQTGLVVPRGDPLALSRALERLLVDQTLAARLAAAARAEVEQRYTIAVNAPRLTAALETVVARFRLATHR